MLGITQDEVRRHPRWREELRTPSLTPSVQRTPASRLLGIVAVVIVLTAVLVLVVN